MFAVAKVGLLEHVLHSRPGQHAVHASSGIWNIRRSAVSVEAGSSKLILDSFDVALYSENTGNRSTFVAMIIHAFR